jgi:hypothetical protein
MNASAPNQSIMALPARGARFAWRNLSIGVRNDHRGVSLYRGDSAEIHRSKERITS